MFTDNERIQKMMDDDNNVNKPWIKLSKNLKIKLVREYAKNMGENCLKMEDYLVNSIMKNKINKAKDVEYDIALGVITNIPNLYFNDRSKNYSLKNNDFRKTILKNFSPKNVSVIIETKVNPIDIRVISRSFCLTTLLTLSVSPFSK